MIIEFVPAVGHGLSDIWGTLANRLLTPERARACGTFMKGLVYNTHVSSLERTMDFLDV